jgi:hypothetical protein
VRKIKEVLRLRFELGLGLRAIARSCSDSGFQTPPGSGAPLDYKCRVGFHNPVPPPF